jgi:hypothetical protein
MERTRPLSLLLGVCVLALGAWAPRAGAAGVAFKVGAAPEPQEVYTKVNLTEPYDIVEGFTIYPSLTSPDLFYYVPKPRLARTEQGHLVFRLLNYAMAENRNQVGSADVAGGYLQFDVVMSPTPQEEKAIKQALVDPPKRFVSSKLNTSRFLVARPSGLHPYQQQFGATAKPKNVRLAPIPIHTLEAKARIPGVLAGDVTDTGWYPANGDASGTTTFALNLSGPQASALYQAIMNPSAVEPFNVFFRGELGGYIKCRAKLTVKTSEVYSFMQQQEGSAKKVEKPGKRGVSLFGVVDVVPGRAASTSVEESQINNIDVSQVLNTAIKIEGDLQGYDDALMALGKYGLDQAIARFGTPISLDELIDPKRELKDPTLPAGVGQPGIWGYAVTAWTGGVLQPGSNPGRKAYWGFFDQKTLDRANSASFTVDLDKQIAVTWQFSPSASIFDDAIVQEIQENAAMYAQKLALNDPFFEKLDITYSANLDFAGGPFNKVVFTDVFKLKDGSDYSVPGLLLESQDTRDPQGRLIGAAPPPNLRFSGLLQGNLYQGPIGGSFNILDPSARRASYLSHKWPTHEDGSTVKGVTHRWKYTVYFRPSVTDIDFPPSWTSPEYINSETVLTATIPPKVAVFTVSADGLSVGSVNAALVKVKYVASLAHRGQQQVATIKSAQVRPGGPDKRLYFYDDDPKVNLPCEYQYTILYANRPPFTSEWIAEEGGIIIPIDPAYGSAPAGSAPAVVDDRF